MIQVGKAIYSLLATNSNVKGKVDKKIFPLIAENGTTYPFITYKRNSLTPSGSKDKYIYSAEATVEINICDNTYNGSCELADMVIVALQGKKGIINTIDILSIDLVDSSEEFTDDTYIQTLTFNIKLK